MVSTYGQTSGKVERPYDNHFMLRVITFRVKSSRVIRLWDYNAHGIQMLKLAYVSHLLRDVLNSNDNFFNVMKRFRYVDLEF